MKLDPSDEASAGVATNSAAGTANAASDVASGLTGQALDNAGAGQFAAGVAGAAAAGIEGAANGAAEIGGVANAAANAAAADDTAAAAAAAVLAKQASATNAAISERAAAASAVSATTGASDTAGANGSRPGIGDAARRQERSELAQALGIAARSGSAASDVASTLDAESLGQSGGANSAATGAGAKDASNSAARTAGATSGGASTVSGQASEGDATATSNTATRGIADAARRQAWSELARALGDKRTTTAGAGSASVAVSTTQGPVSKVATHAAPQDGASAAAQTAAGRVPLDGPSPAAGPQIADDTTSRTRGEASGDKISFTGAEDKATAATFATSAFDANAQSGNGRGNGASGERGDAIASYAASLGRKAGEGATATTTTGFPLHQVTSIVTTQTDALPALGAAAAAGAGPDSGAASANGATATAAQLASQIADTDAAQSVIRSMRLQWTGSTGEAQLRLQPEHLGQVLVSVRVEQGNVSATLQADSASAQQWIQTHQQELRQALQDQGLRVTQFNVTTNPDERRQNASQQQEQGNRQQSSSRTRGDRQNADGRIFEVRV